MSNPKEREPNQPQLPKLVFSTTSDVGDGTIHYTITQTVTGEFEHYAAKHMPSGSVIILNLPQID